MNKTILLLLFTLQLSGTSLAHADGELLPQYLQKIESLQRRADKLAFGEIGSNNYHLAKARTWLDLALGEYHEKDSSGIIAAAVGQAESLLDGLEKKQSDQAMDMPGQIPGSEAVRPDLKDKIHTLKSHDKFACGQRPLAEAEVYLVWAGHEKAESGWSHAQSYARNAENLIYTAQVAIDNCASTAVSVPQAPSVPTAPTAPTMIVVEKQVLFNDALFAFESAELLNSALQRLDKLVEAIEGWNMIEEIVLVGHSDRLRSDGRHEQNQVLSERRAESIKQYLISKGIAAGKIHASGAGATQPVVTCSTKPSKQEQIVCLQPNRRVEITLRGSK